MRLKIDLSHCAVLTPRIRLLSASIAADTIIYPTTHQKKRLFVPFEPSTDQTRAITRLWQKFKTGQ
jgi:hypothetical protein